MIRMRALRLVGIALCLAGVLLGTGLGCSPQGSSAPTSNKPTDKKPDNKPSQPKPDVG